MLNPLWARKQENTSGNLNNTNRITWDCFLDLRKCKYTSSKEVTVSDVRTIDNYKTHSQNHKNYYNITKIQASQQALRTNYTTIQATLQKTQHKQNHAQVQQYQANTNHNIIYFFFPYHNFKDINFPKPMRFPFVIQRLKWYNKTFEMSQQEIRMKWKIILFS